jgi:antitoxin component YwqK of YwqJK toxin-antitoxin module
MLEENYVEGKPHGTRIVWAENGKILAQINYVDGVQVAERNGR